MPCFLTRNNILGTFFYAPYGKRNGGVLSVLSMAFGALHPVTIVLRSRKGNI